MALHSAGPFLSSFLIYFVSFRVFRGYSLNLNHETARNTRTKKRRIYPRITRKKKSKTYETTRKNVYLEFGDFSIQIHRFCCQIRIFRLQIHAFFGPDNTRSLLTLPRKVQLFNPLRHAPPQPPPSSVIASRPSFPLP